MKGRARSLPGNHVEWDNGYKSNMPDWTTARHCALSSIMLYTLKQARTAMLTVDGPLSLEWDRVLDRLQDVIAEADGLIEQPACLPPLPPPPGFK